MAGWLARLAGSVGGWLVGWMAALGWWLGGSAGLLVGGWLAGPGEYKRKKTSKDLVGAGLLGYRYW